MEYLFSTRLSLALVASDAVLSKKRSSSEKLESRPYLRANTSDLASSVADSATCGMQIPNHQQAK